ncbi:MAG: sodium:proton antiporter [Phycisphaerae bacterium]|nr:sodium:proton antiporter [Phycisphaerae bacterium]
MARQPALWLFAAGLIAAFWVGRYVPATWTVAQISLDITAQDVQEDADARRSFLYDGRTWYIDSLRPLAEASLNPERVHRLGEAGQAPEILEELAYEDVEIAGRSERVYYQLLAQRHWRYWSLLPAVVAIGLCWMTREPLPSLFGGAVVGTFLLGQFDLTDAMLIPRLATREAATVLVLYLWLLGGLMGIWSRTGASQAFAELMTRRFVTGPRSAKFVAWLLGVVFFQGGSLSAVLTGTTAKPVADREHISHEELSYIVDSTASPIALLLAFNAWPLYVQAFIFVAGVPWLATEGKRLTFFFACVPLSFYSWFAVTSTLLLSLDRAPFLGSRMRAAIKRARTTGQLDAPDAEPLGSAELETSRVPTGYQPHARDFVVPLAALITVAVGTFVLDGAPKVTWAFGAAVLVAILMATAGGMRLKDLMEGYVDGLKGVVLASVILLLAVTIGAISREAGGGLYLVELLGERIPYWLLPAMLQALAMIIAFSTGTSWGTFAVALPLAMPLAWAVAQSHGMAHPQFFMMLCFSAVLGGSVYGDQCSPISDTTVLSAMCTGCDLMDHVRTQIPPATVAAALAAVCWTALAPLAA